MANTWFFIIALALPALVAWTTLRFTHDSILTMLAVGLLSFILPIYVYDNWIGDFSFERKIPSEIMNRGEKIKNGAIFGALAAIGVAAVLILWSMFMPTWAGPTSITPPFPVFVDNPWLQRSYYVLFIIFFLLMAVLEHIFFHYLVSIEYTEKEG